VNYKEYEVNDRKIRIFDDLFTYNARLHMYNFLINSKYSMIGYDTIPLENKGDCTIISSFDTNDIDMFGILKQENSKLFLPYLEGMNIRQCRVNLSTLNDCNRFHVDGFNDVDFITLLYYPNMNWNLEWGGYTLFSNESTNEIEHCIAYKPGRLVLFDSKIPHCIASPTTLAQSYRLSFAINFARDI